ncbi:MAG: hypothetical protein ACQGVC_16070 [Myxococcota bacterium]
MRRLALLLLALLVAQAAASRELLRSGDASLELTGSAKEILTFTRGTDLDDFRRVAAGPDCVLVNTFPNCPSFHAVGRSDVVLSLSRLRLRFDARAGDHLSAVVVWDQEARLGTLDTFEAQLGEALGSERFLDLTDDIVDRREFLWRQLLYRAYLFYESEKLELTVGRQRIPWGVGRLWNPIDRFNAIGPLAIEADQSQGVDAVKARWLFSGFTYLEAIYAAGKRGEDRAYAARLAGVLRDVDYGLIAGVFEEAPTLGFDLAANLGDAAGRFELVWTDPERRVRPFGDPTAGDLPSYFQIVGSIDYNLDLGSGVYLLLEHLYNGNHLGFGEGEAGGLLGFFQEQGVEAPPTGFRTAAPGSSDLLGQSRVVSQAEHLTGGQLGYDLLPDLRGDLTVLYDWRGRSVALFPTLSYSPTGWLELVLGLQLFEGPRASEYGRAETLGFAQAEVFF